MAISLSSYNDIERVPAQEENNRLHNVLAFIGKLGFWRALVLTVLASIALSHLASLIVSVFEGGIAEYYPTHIMMATIVPLLVTPWISAVVLYLLVELDKAHSALTVLSRTDALTQTFNRGYFNAALQAEILRAARHDQPLSILLADIDHFKQVNDNHGHDAGDAVLRQLARVWRSQLRTSDILARFGGEEFVVLMPHTNNDGVQVIADRLRKSAEQMQTRFGDSKIDVTVSIGIAQFENNESAEQLLRRADKQLYAAKRSGRNRVA